MLTAGGWKMGYRVKPAQAMEKPLLEAIEASDTEGALKAFERSLREGADPWQVHLSLFPVVQQVLNPPFINSCITPVSSVVGEKGFIIRNPTKKRLSYGKLVEKAARMELPKDVSLKEPKDFKIIGKPRRRLDTPEKTNGNAVFGIDVKIPGMLAAVVARSPVFGGKVKSFNPDRAKAVPGVKGVVEVDSGIAVVADGFWPAHKGREACEIVWEEGPLARLSTEGMREE